MSKVLYDGLTRSQMIYKIHMECDTSSGCYKMTDDELVACYKKVFE